MLDKAAQGGAANFLMRNAFNAIVAKKYLKQFYAKRKLH